MKNYSNKERGKNTYPHVVSYIETGLTPGNITIVIGNDTLKLTTNRKKQEGYNLQLIHYHDGGNCSLFDFYW